MAVTRFEIQRRTAWADGAAFGAAGAYEQLEGRVHFAVDPLHPANAAIVDLALAERDPAGRVTFSADFVLVTPKDPARGSGRLLVDVPNRGNALVAATLHRVPALLPDDRLKPGDAWLARRGWSWLAIGWQWDAQGPQALRLAAPVARLDGQPIDGRVLVRLQPDADRPSLALVQLGQTEPAYPVVDPGSPAHCLYQRAHEGAPRVAIDRGRWRFARVPGDAADGAEVPSERHVLLDGGFRKGVQYELVHATRGAPVVGAGLLAVRDAAACVGRGDAASPVGRPFRQVYGFGVSQTGRFLRQFLYDGLNVDAAGRRVFDGLWIHIAGAQRGDFNFRFAQPTVATVPSLGQRFPFAMARARDPVSGVEAGLLDRLAPAHRPRIVVTNTSWEYWRGDAALGHIHGDADLPEPEDVRTYLIAGTHHIGGILAGGRQLTAIAATGLAVAMPLNVVNAAPVSRALLAALDEWVADGRPPPPSRHPRLDDGTAVPREVVLEEFALLGDVAMLAPGKLPALRRQVEQPGNAAGIVEPPIEEREPWPCHVSAVDEHLNEIAGIRLPDLTCPLGVHTGWNARAPGTGAEDEPATFAGFTRFFARADIDAHWPDEQAYLKAVALDVDDLVADRFVLAEDREWMLDLARERYRATR